MDKAYIKKVVFLILGALFFYLLVFELNLMGWILFVIWYGMTSF